jgi:hypothetical protein
MHLRTTETETQEFQPSYKKMMVGVTLLTEVEIWKIRETYVSLFINTVALWHTQARQQTLPAMYAAI